MFRLTTAAGKWCSRLASPVHSVSGWRFASTTTAAAASSSSSSSVWPRASFYDFVTVSAPTRAAAADLTVKFVTAAADADGWATTGDAKGTSVPPKQVAVLPDSDGNLTAFVNIGAAEDVTAAGLRKMAGAAVKAAGDWKAKGVQMELPACFDKVSSQDTARAITQGALTACYKFDRHITKDSAKPHAFTALNVVAAQDDQTAVVEEAITYGNSNCIARDLANERGDVVHPEFMASVCEEMAEDFERITTHVIVEEELWKQGLHCLASVGQAAQRPTHKPRLAIMTYEGNPANLEDRIALVGKGITFDSGGLNLKPTGFMETMHGDMGGAAAVIGAMHGIASLNLPVNVVVAVPLAENAISAEAYKPHCILKSYSGLTVEVGNTDAEGRLALCDAMSFVQRHHKPHTVIDMATLTGACVVALGEHIAGLFANDDETAAALQAAADKVHEPVWRMPIDAEHSEQLAGTFADLRSIGKGRYGGACTAAAFLKEFVEDGTKWAHVDIAGPSMPGDGTTSPATGFGAQLLLEYIQAQQ